MSGWLSNGKGKLSGEGGESGDWDRAGPCFKEVGHDRRRRGWTEANLAVGDYEDETRYKAVGEDETRAACLKFEGSREWASDIGRPGVCLVVGGYVDGG